MVSGTDLKRVKPGRVLLAVDNDNVARAVYALIDLSWYSSSHEHGIHTMEQIQRHAAWSASELKSAPEEVSPSTQPDSTGT